MDWIYKNHGVEFLVMATNTFAVMARHCLQSRRVLPYQLFLFRAAVTAATIPVEVISHFNAASPAVGVRTIVPAAELPMTLIGTVAVIAAVVSLTETALTSGVAVHVGKLEAHPANVPFSCVQTAIAVFTLLRLVSAEAALLFDV